MRRAIAFISVLALLLSALSLHSYLRNYEAWHSLSIDLRDFTPSSADDAKAFQQAISRAEPEAIWPMVGAALNLCIAILGAIALWTTWKSDKFTPTVRK